MLSSTFLILWNWKSTMRTSLTLCRRIAECRICANRQMRRRPLPVSRRCRPSTLNRRVATNPVGQSILTREKMDRVLLQPTRQLRVRAEARHRIAIGVGGAAAAVVVGAGVMDGATAEIEAPNRALSGHRLR